VSDKEENDGRWFIFSNEKEKRGFDAEEDASDSGMEEINPAIGELDSILDKRGLTSEDVNSLAEAGLSLIAGKSDAEMKDELNLKWKELGEYEPVESYNPLDAKEFRMEDEGDPKYLYWPYIPFASTIAATKRDGASELIKEHERTVSKWIVDETPKPWNDEGF
jgi:hypothetical protein